MTDHLAPRASWALLTLALALALALAGAAAQAFAQPSTHAPASAEAPLPGAFEAGWHGARVCEPLFENARMRAARCTFPPGGGHERHYHPPHWGYIVEGGTMRITTAQGSVERVLRSGSSWWSDGIAWHEAVNIGQTTSVYIIVEPKAAGAPPSPPAATPAPDAAQY